MNDRNGTTWLDRVKRESDQELLKLAEAVDEERRKRRRGLRNLVFDHERREWRRRVL